MLLRMHSARNKKERAKLIKEQAREEAKERIHKQKSGNQMITSITKETKAEDIPPNILVQVESLAIVEIALVDSCASLNIVSSKLLWQIS